LPLLWDTPESNRGYVRQGQEKLSELDKVGRADDIKELKKISPDLKESYEVGKEEVDGEYQNKFPSDWPEFRVKCIQFFERLHLLNVEVMRAIALGLDLGEHYFDKLLDNADNTLRLLHYPGVEKTLLDNQTTRRAGAHCDYGSITLLFQDDTGGLEVFDYESKEFIRATPIPGTIVVNAGDMLQRWSNDYLKSTLHRVVKPYIEVGESYPTRYSIAYFCNPNFTVTLECLPNCSSEENPAKYEPINSFDYLVMRLRNTYT